MLRRPRPGQVLVVAKNEGRPLPVGEALARQPQTLSLLDVGRNPVRASDQERVPAQGQAFDPLSSQMTGSRSFVQLSEVLLPVADRAPLKRPHGDHLV